MADMPQQFGGMFSGTVDDLKKMGEGLLVDFERAGKRLIDHAADRFGEKAAGAIVDLFKGENNIIAALDGWTLTVTHAALKEPLTIRLHKPT